MPCWPAPRYSSWCCDDDNRLILMKVPAQINLNANPVPKSAPVPLSTLDKSTHPPRPAPLLATLPPELHYTIFHHLTPVDRVCLALTCRRLCSSVLSSPRLTAGMWAQLMGVSPAAVHHRNHYTTYLIPGPEHYQLPLRLAHGWVDKKRWRYCWKCHRILPREEDWWWNTRDANGDKRILARKNARWSIKTGVSKEQWLTWSKKKKLRWIVNVWCKAGWEDSSVIGCETCRPKLEEEEERAELQTLSIGGHKSAWEKTDPDGRGTGFIGTRHPVQCPTCLERELTWSWKPSRSSRFWKDTRRTLRSMCDCLTDVIWCTGGMIMALIMITWSFCEWVGRSGTRILTMPARAMRTGTGTGQ